MNPQAFTVRNSKPLRELLVPCMVCLPYGPEAPLEPITPIGVNSIWDTGASNSVISKNIVEKLGLKPFSKTKINHAQGESIVNLYLVNIILPNRIQVHNVKVSEGVLPNFDVLIGMDIINLGDFSITHKNGGTVFSFQIPSTHEYDFVKQIHNASLPTKSGKKKKK